MANGQGGSGNDDELTGAARLWLWPLPAGDLRLVVQWKEAGMPEQSLMLDGGQIAAGALLAQKY